jgi:small subunit ribosomal protein S17
MDSNKRKELVGVVYSDKRDITITIFVERKEKHPLYGKVLKKSKKFQVHDENNDSHVGDTVRVMETRPLSKTKRFRLVEIIEKAK